jgi:hypothetical protein
MSSGNIFSNWTTPRPGRQEAGCHKQRIASDVVYFHNFRGINSL